VLYIGTLNKLMFVSLRLAYVVVPPPLVEPLANLRTQLDGFTPALAQRTASWFMEEGHLATHLRRMRGVYGVKRAALVRDLAPLADLGWSWSEHAAGLHLLARHASAGHVRAVAAASGLDLALLSSYRIRAREGDGLLLRFGGLDLETVAAGAAALVAAALATPRRARSGRARSAATCRHGDHGGRPAVRQARPE
jgi:GntR family transcriptional regulator/MocR family aminotransferase